MKKLRVIKSDNGGRPRWVADVEGDPGRTLCLDSAKLFTTQAKAEEFRLKVIKDNPHRPHLINSLYVDSVPRHDIEESDK